MPRSTPLGKHRLIRACVISLFAVALLASPFLFLERGAHVSESAHAVSRRETLSRGAEGRGAAARPDALAQVDPATRARLTEAYGQLPMRFEANRGQTDAAVKFVARGQGYALFLTPTEAVLSLRQAGGREESAADAGGPEGASQAGAAEESPSPSAASSPSGAVLRVGLVGANPAPALEGVEELSGRSNYFVGADERGWVTDVAGFGAVKYESVYPGVDLVYYGQQRQLEYDFRLDAGADPARIALHFEGAQTVALGAGGDLVLGTEVGEVRQRRPFIYQEIDGARREVAGGYKLLGENRVAFEVGEYDQSRPLVIDPVLVYSTYLGGNDSDAGFGVAVDAAGNAYVAGDTFSTDFPGPSPIQAAKDVSFDAFVLKLNPTGSGLVYATYLGGNGDDFGNAVAVDPAGNAYVVGYTTSDIFPLTAGALQQSRLGVIDGYVAKLNPTGSALVYSTLLGGNNNDEVLAVAADAAGNAYVAGYTDSSEIASAGVFDMRAGSPIYRSADGGGSWAEADNGFTASRVNFFAAHPTDAATIYAGAASGVFKTTDGGNLWSLTGAAQPSTLPRFVNWVAVHPTTPETVYAATFAGAYKSTDGGQTYEEKNTGLFDQNLLTIVIDPATPTTLYAGSFFGANKSTNGGDNWTQINNGLRAASFSFEPQVFDLVIDPTNPSVLYAGTSQGIFKTTNGGANWAPLNTGLGSAFTPPSVTTLLMDPQNPATLYAAVTVFGGNQLLKTTNGGGEWNVVGAGLRTTIGATTFTPRIDALAIDPANSSVLYAGTLGSGVFKSTDGGANWAQASAGLNNNSVGAIVVDRAVPSHVFAGTNIGSDAFAGKINPEGTAVVHFRFLGGNENDMATGVVADPAGNAYITGHTASNNFPVLGALQPAKGGGTDAFLTKLNPSGAGLVYSTYLGGFATDEARAVALGPAGSAYLTGRTQSTNFPLASPLKFSPPSFIDDAFVSRISADGTTLLYSTYLGGDSGTEQGFGIAVDAAGNAHVTGLTSSNDFPLVGAVQTTRGGGNDAFVSKLNPSGTALAFSTYHGGAGNDVGNAVAVDAAGNTYFVGATNSFNLPLAAPFQNAYRGGGDAFIAKLGSSIELAVAMTDSPDPVAFGSNLTYSLTVSNNGELSAAGVTLTDTLPAGATFVSATPGQGSCSGTTTVTCNLGTLNGGAATTVAIVVLPPAVRNISNTASVTSNEADPLPANNTATESTQVNFADLSVTGAASYGKVAPGARINYLFRVANNSGGPAESATLSGNLPAGTTFVSCGAVGGVCSNSGGSWAVTFPSLAVGQSAAVVLVAAVDAAVAEGAVLGHTATAAAAATPDPDAGNNSAAVTVTVTATPLRVKTNGLIAFASDGVHTVKADASAPPAPFPGAEGGIFPRWSPDGTRLAYTVQKRQPTYPNDAYYVIEAANADGSGRLTLADNVIDTSFDNRSGFSWSPDGTRLAYVGTDRLIYLANADGSGYAKLPGSPTQVRDVDWSPDGSRFVFSKDFGEIYVMNVDGSGLSKLVAFGTGPDGPTHYLSPLWSPDMTKILFVQRSNNFTDILFMRSDGTGAQRLLNRGQTSGPAWSPDGKRIAFYHGTEMHVVDFDGTDELTLVTNQSCCGFGGTSWQPIPTDAPLPPPPPDAPSYKLSGQVTAASGAQFILGQLQLTGPVSATIGIAGGPYEFIRLPPGQYTVTPVSITHTFSPQSRTVTIGDADVTGVDFFATFVPVNITGRVTDAFGRPIAGIKMTSTGGFPEGATFTDAGGFYSFPNVQRFRNYVVYPDPAAPYVFEPSFRNFPGLTTSQVADFVGTRRNNVQFAAAAVSAGEGDGSAVITVTRTGDTADAATVSYATASGAATDRADFTPALGALHFAAGETTKTIRIIITDDVIVEGSETLSVVLSAPVGAFLVAPATSTVEISDNDADPNAPNPIDDARFFVRQHYADFLNREPDEAGLNFWSGQITGCGADASCVDSRRQNVSAAFFLSIEFQQTGYLVYRTYGAAFGTTRVGGVAPLTLQEFLPDTQRIGLGVVVNAPGWEQQLEQNKQAYLEAFVARPPFVSLYPQALTPGQFVDALNANAGASLSTPERDALVGDLTNGGKTRAQVLRAVVEDADFDAREKNRAFVLMQYFGYLRRNPNDAPELNLDFGGYNFWLGKLNQFGGNHVAAEMVKAFITSGEYRERFR